MSGIYINNDEVPPSANQEDDRTQEGRATQDDDEGPAMSARYVGHLRKIYGSLKAIQVDAKCQMLVECDPKGLKFTVEHAQTVQARAFLQAGLFCEYDCIDEDITPFCIDSSTLLACLNIFQSGTSNVGDGVTTVSIRYDGEGSPLVLMVEEGGVIAECEIKTMMAGDMMDFNSFTADEVEVKIIFDSEALKEVFSELDKSSSTVAFAVAKDDRVFSVSTRGNNGEFTAGFKDGDHVDKDAPSIFTYFETTKAKVVNEYPLQLLRPCERGLGLATKTSLKMNDRGFLKMQNMIHIDIEGHSQPEITYIEYTCAPVEDEES